MTWREEIVMDDICKCGTHCDTGIAENELPRSRAARYQNEFLSY